jgi:hypothetical protein
VGASALCGPIGTAEVRTGMDYRLGTPVAAVCGS